MSKLLDLAKNSILTKRKDFLDMVKFFGQEGASHAETYLFHGCVKVGDRSIVRDQMEAYECFKHSLGNTYGSIFPRCRLISEEKNDAVLLIEFLAGRNLEDVCFEIRDLLPFLSIENHVIQNKLSLIIRIVEQCIEKLCLIFEKTRRDNGDKELLLLECFDALEVNLVESDLKNYLPIAQTLKEKQRVFLDPLIVSLSHKDFTVRNVMVSDKQGTLDIRFVDPRISLPRSSKRYTSGSIAVDMAAIEMSLSRKEVELQQFNPLVKIEGISLIRAEVEKMIKKDLFSKAMYKLCLATFYSAHAACTCVYCSATERSWLREVMKQRTRELLDNLSQEVGHAE